MYKPVEFEIVLVSRGHESEDQSEGSSFIFLHGLIGCIDGGHGEVGAGTKVEK